MESIYSTSSIHDSAYVLITLHGRYRGCVGNGKRCLLQFASVDGDVEKAVEQFRSGALANAREFARATGFVRDRIFEVTNKQQKELPRQRNNATRAPLQPQAV